MKIGKREIGQGHPPYIIAEIGANHGGDLAHALRLIESAKAAGADAVKFQAYTADTITIDSQRDEFILKEGPWKGWKLYDLYKRCETPFKWFPKIAEHAKSCRIDWFASVFDESAVDVLDELDCVAIKIASFEIIDLPLIKYAAETRRPLILSTGMAEDTEIKAALDALGGSAPRTHALLHCVSGYPTPVEQAGFVRMADQMRWINMIHGISDHSIGIEVPIAATALGATIIEKHFRMANDGIGSPDALFSMEPLAFRKMAVACRGIWKAMQDSGRPESERAQEPLRPSLYAVEDIPAGEPFTEQNVRSIRPGAGLPPAMLDEVLKHKAACPINRGTPLSRELLG